ncbi:MAG: hypothetical protein LC790_19565, partial [Actinobacteria bacterium]|nr:hypothetical protein [Actinomycetota bacterium]
MGRRSRCWSRKARIADVGWLNAARWLPYLVFGLVVGAIVDGRRRLPLMVGADLLQAALLLT